MGTETPETALSNAAQRAVVDFARRQHITDCHPRIAETFNYATAGLTVAIEVDGAAMRWDIEIRRDGQQIVACWGGGQQWETHVVYANGVPALLPLILAAITAAGRGSLMLEVAPAA